MNSRKRSADNFLTFGSPLIEQPEIDEVVATLKSSWLGAGPKVQKFEIMFKELKGSKFALAVNSCTAALHLSMLAIGIKSGDEVLVPAMTFVSSANAIVHAGGTPVLVDCLRDTMNIDPDDIKRKITPRTKAIIPVHFAGRPCQMDSIMKIARDNNLRVVEDCAHAISAMYKGNKTGLFGDIGCFSFYVTKNITTGEGGMVITNNKGYEEKIKILALHGMTEDAWSRFSDVGYKHYDVLCAGYKYNMMDLQAALGIHQLARIDQYHKKREIVWLRYNEAFKDLPVFTPCPIEPDTTHSLHLYTILLDLDKLSISRDQFLEEMTERNIGVGVHYLALNLLSFYQKRYGYKRGDFPNAEWISDRTVSLPISPKLTQEDVSDVISAVRDIIISHSKVNMGVFNDSPKEITLRTLPEPHNTQYLEAMAVYNFAREYIKDKVVIDVGCGFGYGAAYLSAYAKQVVGVDIDARVVEWAKKHYAKKNVRFFASDVTELDLLKESFDVVCFFEAFHQLEDYEKALGNLNRILKKEGALLLSTRRKSVSSGGDPAHKNIFADNELEDILKKHGFGNIEMYGIQRAPGAYEVEEKLQKIRRLDLLRIKKFIPRKVISALVYFICKISGITPPQEFNPEDFRISKDSLDLSPGSLVVCRKDSSGEGVNASAMDLKPFNQRKKVSCLVGTKNSEFEIVDCLESLKWADEVIVVDDFSKDRTLEIALQYGATVYQREFEGFPQQRKFALEKATHRWVLALNADERVSVKLRDEILEELSSADCVDGYLMRRLNIFLKKEIRHCGWYESNNVRFFDKEKAVYDAALTYLDSAIVFGTTKRFKNYIVHYCCSDLRQYLERIELWASLRAKNLIAKRQRINFLNGLFYFFCMPCFIFGKKYFLRLGFCDGRMGLLICFLSAYACFVSYAKVLQNQYIRAKTAFRSKLLGR